MKGENIPYALLAKYFAKQCTAAEEDKIHRWRNENAEQDTLFCKLERQWEQVHLEISDPFIPSKGQIWQRVQNEINLRAKQLPLYPRSLLIRVAGIAAMIALIAGLSVSLLFRQTEHPLAGDGYINTVMAPKGQKSQLVLPDGTLVWLNSGSRLSYSYQYHTTDRVVALEGEAYFEVKHNEQLPFIVQMGGVDVKVHGTVFNAQAYADEQHVVVSLISGSVSLLRSQDQTLLTYLHPNESATISTRDLLCEVIPCDAETDASWHLDNLRFDGATSEEMWKKISRWYGVKITTSNTKPDNQYWLSLKTESLTELLGMINKLTPIEYQINGEEVNIQYK